MKIPSIFRRIWVQLRFSLTHYTVEPIIFLIYFGWVFGNTFRQPAIYSRICRIYYGEDTIVDCNRLRQSHVETNVQEWSALWTLFNAVAYLLPAIFADTILGAYGDRYGRKINILIGTVGIAVSEFGYLLTLSHTAQTPYWSTVLFALGTGFTGYLTLIPVSCNAYLADTTPDSDVLTIRSGIFSAFQTVASLCGAFLAAAFHDAISVLVAINVELFFFLLAAVYTLWRIPQAAGLEELDRRIRERSQERALKKTFLQHVSTFFCGIVELLRDGLNTYRKKRDGHRRAFMFITVAVLCLSYTTMVETRTTGVINTFVFRSAESDGLDWNAEDLGLWHGTGYSLLLFGTLLGLFVFKKVLKLRETSVLLIGLTSSALRAVLIGIARADWVMYLANVAGLFAGLVQPAAVSFIVQLVSPSEIGRAFSLFGICGDVAFLLTSLVYSTVYRVTVAWFPGFLFLLIGFVQFIAVGAMTWVHIQSKREGISKTVEPPPTDVRRAISRIGDVYDPTSMEKSRKERKQKKKTDKIAPARQISIIEMAEQLAGQRNELPIWGSTDDVRRGSVKFF